jgi:hypothetical protein
MCVVLASRSDPPLELARLRARGQLAEVRVAELRFTPAEAAELLQWVASALPDASVAGLAARTEGWQAQTPGQVTPWCPLPPGRFHLACPLSGDAWPAGSS